MNSLIEKNPFSIYDFLGYLFPGAIVLIFLICAIHNDFNNLTIGTFKSIKIFENFTFVGSLFFIITSYVLGHLIAYTSSLTVEKFSLWLYGYPSEFLLGQRKKTGFWISFITTSGTKLTSLLSSRKIDNFVFAVIIQTALKLLVSLILFPLAICVWLCHLLYFDSFITRPVDDFTLNAIHSKFRGLVNILGLRLNEHNKEGDFLKVMYHYYLHKPNNGVFMQKVNNYVALYGFLRSVTFVFNIITIFSIFLINKYQSCYSYLIPAVFSIFTFVSFLAYMKFYRRYSLEIFMYLATDEEINVEN